MPSPKLKPCPWCRHSRTLGQATERIDAGSPKLVIKFHVSCGGCGAMGPSAKTFSEAVAAWNRRTVDVKKNGGILTMKTNLIQWPRAKYWDKAWNPIIGCKPCSPACENCYAAAWAKRFGQSFEPHKTTHENPPRTGVVFCGNMTDLFGEWVPHDQAADNILATQWCADDGLVIGPYDATYIWLTKRVTRMCSAIDNCGLNCGGLEKHYFGFTAENQECYDRRQQESLALPTWAKMWYSLEPLLGPIQLGAGVVRSSLRWVVVGCESGPNRRPCKIEWVESIVEQCQSSGVPVFVKQLDLGGKCVADINKFPKHLRIRQVPWNRRAGKEME